MLHLIAQLLIYIQSSNSGAKLCPVKLSIYTEYSRYKQWGLHFQLSKYLWPNMPATFPQPYNLATDTQHTQWLLECNMTCEPSQYRTRTHHQFMTSWHCWMWTLQFSFTYCNLRVIKHLGVTTQSTAVPKHLCSTAAFCYRVGWFKITKKPTRPIFQKLRKSCEYKFLTLPVIRHLYGHCPLHTKF